MVEYEYKGSEPMSAKKKVINTEKAIVEGTREFTLKVQDTELNEIIAQKKACFKDLMKEFLKEGLKIKYDKLGNEINETNPYLVSTYFFKPINPQPNVETIYNSEQLTKVYDYYSKVVEQINLKVMPFQPTLSHFAKFAGMSLNQLANLRQSDNISMRNLVQRIYDDTFDANVMLSQHHKLEKTTTTYRMKVENEALEKKTPEVKVSVTTKPIDLDNIEERIATLKTIQVSQKMIGEVDE